MTGPPEETDRAARLVSELLDISGATTNRDLLRDILVTGLSLGRIDASRLDLKIAASALAEMGRAFDLFAPYRGVRKLTIFGSARTSVSDPTYAQAVDVAARMARENWLVVTGAGPGIMAAGADGAGPEMSLGVEIRLPFETVSHPQLAAEGRVVEMKYFFTRKLMLMKESSAFAVLPGGFGTLDECFELFTLLQTGKAEPAPIVLLDAPGDPYWEALESFLKGEVTRRGLIDHEDAALYLVTDDVSVAVAEILRFYRNYQSRRFVGATMVVRCRYGPTDEQLAQLNEDFADICTARGIWRTGPLPPERAGQDQLELKRLALEFDRRSHGRLRMMIDQINSWPEPAAPQGPSLAVSSAGPPPSTA